MTNDKDCAALLREACAHMVARCEALEDESHNALATDLDNHAAGFHRGQKSTAKALRREFHDLTRTLKSHGQAFDAADKTKSTRADIEGLAYDVHHHWSVGHKDEAVAAILRFCPLVDTAGVREACAKVAESAESCHPPKDVHCKHDPQPK